MSYDPSSQERPPVISDGDRVVDEAVRFLAYISADPASKFAGDGSTWDHEDNFALFTWTELEQRIGYIDTHRDSEDRMEPVKRFQELCHSFHTALPYSEAEREWLLRRALKIMGEDNEPELLSQLEDQVVSAGIRQTVRGRDLMRRWIAWHREADEYAGQNALGVARSALAGLVGLLEPKQPLPEPYLALMRERDSTP